MNLAGFLDRKIMITHEHNDYNNSIQNLRGRVNDGNRRRRLDQEIMVEEQVDSGEKYEVENFALIIVQKRGHLL
jgi:hypothetical protein